MVLRPGRDVRIRQGHLWVFRTEIAAIEGEPADGDVVAVVNARGRVLGAGFLNRHSLITVRLLAEGDGDVDEALLRSRLERALVFRQKVVSGTTAYRLVYGEGDLLPGLVVDRYADVLVMQTLTLGMERRKALLADLLRDLVGPRAIYERNDPAVRRLEGLPRQAGWIVGGGATEVEVEEDGARFVVDIARGQKTGFFLDQRENRVHVAGMAPGGEVLDCFAYTGAWGIHAARRGAARVTGVEISEEAVALATRNAALNEVGDRCQFTCGNAFDELRRLAQAGARFDMVVLDPPAFVKTRDALPSGLTGYKEVNLRAFKMVRPGGWVVTCSCSYHVDERQFLSTVLEAARDARRDVRLVESRSQARDHPVHLAMPETRYLKCLILEVG